MTESFINIRSSQVRWLILISYLIGLIIDSMVLLYSSLEFLPPMTLIALLYWSGHFLDRTYFVSAFLLHAKPKSTIKMMATFFMIFKF